ncbi:MAG: type I restriction endonuclease subunit R [Phycisphaerae bacterium]|nr:type I restriction endonuclease subunit R [Phycisphaerae bacterium]
MTPVDTSERDFEASIERAMLAHGPQDATPQATGIAQVTTEGVLTPGGYQRRKPDDYDRELCLIPSDVIDFIYATQPKEWEKLKKLHGEDAKAKFLRRLASEIQKRGTIDVLRKGVKDHGCSFEMVCFKPSHGLNPEILERYQANLFSVVRQLEYSLKGKSSLDLGVFVNGLPIFTAELKDPFKGQDVTHAMRQYQFDRDPREPLFAFGRCLAHFAVDPELVYLTTHLKGPKTEFIPFNRGRDGGAGNPQSWRGFPTAYLWEQVWSKDSVLNLIQHFIHVVDMLDDKGRKTGEQKLLFPRFHQLDCVRRLVEDARWRGTGQKYLIQHSAGSGKSNSISWLAHQLSVLHDKEDRRVFDSIVVLSDRRVIDRQLQQTVKQFEQTLGLVENIDKTSKQLKQALEEGKTIIVTTLQKFPVIVNEIGDMPGTRFAVIVDEAHSSQTGESTKSLKEVLSVERLEEAEAVEGKQEDLEDTVIAEMRKRQLPLNVSMFAFTATPKSKTIEIFGTKTKEGKYVPYSLYTMRQAIEEKFILDVLENYTTYHEYWNLLKKIEDDPSYDRRKAAFLLRQFVDLHEHTINKKVAIIVEHFASQVAHRIKGRAKAMIVTRSRLHAVRYKLALDAYLREHGHRYRSLVAFSGKVKDGQAEFTEQSMNGFSESKTAETFKRDEYRLLVVAFKFQTGFDQPLLHTMYVDQKLGGVQAVQTLSRLNRVHPEKSETMVLDFANTTDEIKKAFESYHDRTYLREGTDPNLLHDLEQKLDEVGVYSRQDVQAFAEQYFRPGATQDKLFALLDPVVERFRQVSEDEQKSFRSYLTDYVRLYSFLSQIIPFSDPELEKLYVFARLLRRKLPVPPNDLPREILEQVDMRSLRIEHQGTEGIRLGDERKPLESQKPKDKCQKTPEDVDALSEIIRQLNERFGTDFTEEDKVFIEHLEVKLDGNRALEASVRVNTPENARLTFDHVVSDQLQDMIDTNFKFYKQVTDNPRFAQFFLAWLFERYYDRKKAVGE